MLFSLTGNLLLQCSWVAVTDKTRWRLINNKQSNYIFIIDILLTHELYISLKKIIIIIKIYIYIFFNVFWHCCFFYFLSPCSLFCLPSDLLALLHLVVTWSRTWRMLPVFYRLDKGYIVRIVNCITGLLIKTLVWKYCL